MGKQPSNNQHLTSSLIWKLKPPRAGNVIYRDDEVPGFGVRVTAAGARAFVLNYRVRGSGRERRFTIGGFPGFGATEARKEAIRLRHLVDKGGDPLAELEAEREAPTVADLCDRFEKEHLPRKRPGTAADYRRMLANHIRPHFGAHTKAADVTFADVDRLHRKITAAGYPRRANTVVAVLSRMFSLSIRWGIRGDNPCKGIERNGEVKRKRYLTGEELTGLSKALAAHPNKDMANVVRLLLLTGARRGEVLGMRWGDLDMQKGVWSKPGATTKQKTDHIVPLSAPARLLLGEIRTSQTGKHRTLGEFVFPHDTDDGQLTALKRAWRRVCKDAGITNLRVHDLRHSFASQLASGGASLPLIGALLGHSNPVTTARYAHLYDDPQRAAVERVGAVIDNAAGKSAPAPIPMTGKRRGR